MFFFSKFYIQNIIIFLFILINFTLSEKDLIENIYDTFFFINDEVIEIIKRYSNNYVYNFNIDDDVKDILLKYNQTVILPYKNLISVSEDSFLYLKLNEYNIICMQTYKFSEDGPSIDSLDIEFVYKLDGIKYLEGKLISEKKILLSCVVRNNFEIVIIDLNNNELKINIIPEIVTIETKEIESYKKNTIQCESVDGNNFFCILNFLNNNDCNLFFIELNLENMEKINSKIICDDNCVSANIIRGNNIDNKYLICYQKIEGEYLYTICQYYTLINDDIVVGDSHVISKIYEKRIKSILNLSLYKNTVFIQFDTESNIGSNSYISSNLIVSSLDFKISFNSILMKSLEFSSIFLINNDNYICYFYEKLEKLNEYSGGKNEGGFHTLSFQVKYVYRVKRVIKQLKKCLNVDSLIISNEKKEVDFTTNHINDKIFFFFDNNIQLYKDKEIINLELNNDIKIEINTYFQLGKLERSGVFQNFYYYVSGEFNELFSLICPITITICYFSCQTCVANKIPSINEHYCTSCIDNHSPMGENLNITNGYNCYLNCHYSCTKCVNNFSCESCKEGYYFKSDTNNNIIEDICYNSTLENYYLDNSVNFTYKGEIIKAVYKPYNKITNLLTTETIQLSFTTTIFTNIPTEIPTSFITNSPYINPTIIQVLSTTTISTNIPTEIPTSIITIIPIINPTTNPIIIQETTPTTVIQTTIIDSIPTNYTSSKRIIIKANLPTNSIYTFEEDFDVNIIIDYAKILNDEKEKYNNDKKIYLIAQKMYNKLNYSMTIYPLDIEEESEFKDYIKENNLTHGNFKNIFNDFINYEKEQNCLILIILIEDLSKNSAFNNLNYYIYRFKENNDNFHNVIDIRNSRLNLININNKLEIIYPLNIDIIQRNGDSLSTTLKKIKDIFKNITLLNPSHQFFNDICVGYKSKNNTDVSMNERINEFINDINLCENNCKFINLVDIEKKTFSLCNCSLKYKFSFNEQSKQKEIHSKRISNINAVRCIKKLFDKNNKIIFNPNFWICLILFIFQLNALFNGICKGEKQINKILTQKKPFYTKFKKNTSKENIKEEEEKENDNYRIISHKKGNDYNSKDILINDSKNNSKIKSIISEKKDNKQNIFIDNDIFFSDKDFTENKSQIEKDNNNDNFSKDNHKTRKNSEKDSSPYNRNANKEDNNNIINENSRNYNSLLKEINESIDINIIKGNGKENSERFNSKKSSSNIDDSNDIIIKSIYNSVSYFSNNSSLSSKNKPNLNIKSNISEDDYISSEKDYKQNYSNERESKTETINLNFIEEKKNGISNKEYTIIIESLNIENNFFCCLWDYFKKREILFIAFLNVCNETPKFIKSSVLFFCLTTFLTINCLLFDESLLDKRYHNLLDGKNKKNGISYFFKNEFKISVYSALIGNTIKILLIKIIIYGIFRLNKKEISIINVVKPSKKLKNKASKDYIRNIKIYFFIIIITNLFMGYICICYGAVFENSYSFFILSFLVSYLLSILFCCFFCIVNILTYKIWRKTNSIIAISLFIVLNKLY